MPSFLLLLLQLALFTGHSSGQMWRTLVSRSWPAAASCARPIGRPISTTRTVQGPGEPITEQPREVTTTPFPPVHGGPYGHGGIVPIPDIRVVHVSNFHLRDSSGAAKDFPDGPLFLVVEGTASEDWAHTIGETGALSMPSQEMATEATATEQNWLSARSAGRERLAAGTYNRHVYEPKENVPLIHFDSMENAYAFCTATLDVLKDASPEAAAEIEASSSWKELQIKIPRGSTVDPHRWELAELRLPVSALVGEVVGIEEKHADALKGVELPLWLPSSTDAEMCSDSAGGAAATNAFVGSVRGISVWQDTRYHEVILFHPQEDLKVHAVESVNLVGKALGGIASSVKGLLGNMFAV